MSPATREHLAFHFNNTDSCLLHADRRDAAIMYRAEWNRTHGKKPAERTHVMTPLLGRVSV